MTRWKLSKQPLLRSLYLKTRTINVRLFSILQNTNSAPQNCCKGILFSWRTLLGTFLSRHLRHYFKIKQGYEMVHHTALPSSACVAHRTYFNGNSDIWWGHRKPFESMESTDPKVQSKNLLHGPQILLFKYQSVSKAISGETQKHMDSRADLIVFVLHWSTTKENEKELVPLASICPNPSSQVTQRLWREVNCYSFFFFFNSTLHPQPNHHFLWSLLEKTQTWFGETTRLDVNVKYILKVLFCIVLPGNQPGQERGHAQDFHQGDRSSHPK